MRMRMPEPRKAIEQSVHQARDWASDPVDGEPFAYVNMQAGGGMGRAPLPSLVVPEAHRRAFGHFAEEAHDHAPSTNFGLQAGLGTVNEGIGAISNMSSRFDRGARSAIDSVSGARPVTRGRGGGNHGLPDVLYIPAPPPPAGPGAIPVPVPNGANAEDVADAVSDAVDDATDAAGSAGNAATDAANDAANAAGNAAHDAGDAANDAGDAAADAWNSTTSNSGGGGGSHWPF